MRRIDWQEYTCEDCLFWSRDELAGGNQLLGWCHANPPQLGEDGEGVFPRMHYQCSCSNVFTANDVSGFKP
jgi:hypothetical protein